MTKKISLLVLCVFVCSCNLLWRQEPSIIDVSLQELSLLPAWEYESDAKIRRIIGSTDGKLILYTNQKQFIAIDADTGELVWSYQLSGSITDLVTTDEIILKDGLLVFTSFIDSSDTKLSVLDAEAGEELWSLDDRDTGHAAATFAVGDKYVYWALWPHYLAFDRYTGELAWQSELSTGPGGYSGLLYDNKELTIVRPDMYVLDANNGKIKRELDFKINSTVYRIFNGVIYFIRGKVQALDTKTNEILWEKYPKSSNSRFGKIERRRFRPEKGRGI